MSSTTRRIHVLNAIVVEHVETNEPVSSKAVAQGHVSGVSSATIRSDMSALERQGLIQQPHTSAGRVPTDAGYRTYVDHLRTPGSLNEDALGRIRIRLRDAADIDQLLAEAVRALSLLTGQAAIAEFPDLSLAGVKRVELIDIGTSRLLVLVISTSGRVAERTLELSDIPLPDEAGLRKLSNQITDAVVDKRLHQIGESLQDLVMEVEPGFAALTRGIADAIGDILRPLEVSKLTSAGVSNLARRATGFTDPASILEAVESPVDLVRILREVHSGPLDVSIGVENQSENLMEAALVSATYSGQGEPHVHVGVLGPTRMNYELSLAAVQAVSRCLTQLLWDAPEDAESSAKSPKEGSK